jgi:hypothetical protein
MLKSPLVLKLDHCLVIGLFALWLTNLTQAQDTAWVRHTIDSGYSGADGVRIADVNNDNLPDIATGWEEAGYTKVYLHPGYKRVRQKWPSVIVGNNPDVEDAVVVDIDGDGAVDVVSSTEGKTRKVYINRAPVNPDDYLDATAWTSEVLPSSDGLMQWMFAIPAQIDEMNGVDLVVGAKGSGAKIGWFQAPEKATQLLDWSWHPISNATWVMSLLLRDVDHDGDMDIVTSDRKPGPTNGIRWLENPGAANNQKLEWDNHFIGAQDLEVMFMDMADLDGDGLEDAIVTEYTTQKIVYMRKVDHSGLKWERHDIDIPAETGRAKAVKVGDINGDGKPDLVHSTNTLNDDSKVGIVWMSYKNGPTDPVWEWHHLSGPEGYKYDRIELLDLDGDGDLDVLTCEENYGTGSRGLGVIWYENPFNKSHE